MSENERPVWIQWRIEPRRSRGTTKYSVVTNCPAEPKRFDTLCSGNLSAAEALEFMEKAYPAGYVIATNSTAGELRCDVPEGVTCVCGIHPGKAVTILR